MDQGPKGATLWITQEAQDYLCWAWGGRRQETRHMTSKATRSSHTSSNKAPLPPAGTYSPPYGLWEPFYPNHRILQA